MWDEYNCAVVWAFFGIAFLWNWKENWPFPVLWAVLSFPNLLTYWVQHFHSIIFITWNNSVGIPSSPLALFVVMLTKTHLTCIPGYLALSEWSHHRDYLDHEDIFLYSSSVYSHHLFLISSASVRSIQFLSLFVPIFVENFAWHFWFSWRHL